MNRRKLLLVGATLFSLVATSTFVSAGESDWNYRFEPAAGITAAGQPSEAGLKELADDGYAAVIDLRTAGEDRGLDEETAVEELGMDYVSLPIAGSRGINFENAKKLDQILNNYDGPVIIHCASSNRVGALLAMREKLNGAGDEDALAFGKAAGMTNLESTVTARIAEN